MLNSFAEISFFGGLIVLAYGFVLARIKDVKHGRELRETREDADIANGPSKHGNDLLDSLSDD